MLVLHACTPRDRAMAPTAGRTACRYCCHDMESPTDAHSPLQLHSMTMVAAKRSGPKVQNWVESGKDAYEYPDQHALTMIVGIILARHTLGPLVHSQPALLQHRGEGMPAGRGERVGQAWPFWRLPSLGMGGRGPAGGGGCGCMTYSTASTLAPALGLMACGLQRTQARCNIPRKVSLCHACLRTVHRYDAV